MIDDDADDRELFEIALEKASIKINYIGVDSCCNALEFLKTGGIIPDYIFLDLNMPQMSGRECLSELKSNIRLSQIPVIIFTTSSDPQDKKDTVAMGAIDFITKPSKTSELARVMNEFIAERILKPTQKSKL